MLNKFITRIVNAEPVTFAETLEIIDQFYTYTPCAFSNGLSHPVLNPAGTNQGSCKVFAFAQLHQLDQQQTLRLFGEHYQSVLQHPDADDHQNIRRFMQDGWPGINYEAQPLTQK